MFRSISIPGALALAVVTLMFSQSHWCAASEVYRVARPSVQFRTDGIEAAYASAMHANKPLVVFFTHRHEDGTCDNEQRMLDAFDSPEFTIGGDEAIFVICVISDPTGGPLDEVAAGLAESLDVSTYPTVSVINPSPEQVIEVGRLEGVFSGEAMSEHIRAWFTDLAASRE